MRTHRMANNSEKDSEHGEISATSFQTLLARNIVRGDLKKMNFINFEILMTDVIEVGLSVFVN